MIFIFFKIHLTPEGNVLAVCDEEIIGKTFEDEKFSFTVYERFYGNEKADEKKVEKLFKEHHNINIVGKKCVDIAIRKGLITLKNVIMIAGIPHAIILRI